MTENEPYTPTTQQVRDAVLMSGKPFDQIVEIDDPVEGYSIHDQYVEPGAAFARWLTQHDAEVLTAARPRLVAESREALVDIAEAAIEQARKQHEDELGQPWVLSEVVVDALIAAGVVTLATPTETRAAPSRSEQYEADQKPAASVDALGFPTQEGATFTAAVALGERRTLRFRVVGLGRFRAEGEGGTWGRVDLNPASIEDVRPADGRNGQ